MQKAYDPPLTQCRFCQSSELVHYDHDHLGAQIDRCNSCGVKFMNPQYTDAYLEEYYSNYIHEGYHPGEQAERDRSIRKKRSLDLIQKHQSPGRLLCIGCGDGLELRLAEQQGWSVVGYDVDPTVTERLQQELGVPVHSGALGDLNEPPFDCIYVDQVLEHPKNPAQMLREIDALLVPNGIVYLGVPNIESLSSRYKTIMGKLGLKRKRGKHYDSWHHLFYYGPKTLTQIMERRGYQVLELKGDPNHPSDSVIDSLSQRFPLLESTFCLVARKGATQ